MLAGFDALKYVEHQDYELIQSNLGNNQSNNQQQGSKKDNFIVRVNIFKQEYRQTIQYVSPEDSHYLTQAELLVIDEAAAIPLPTVKKLLGPYLIFMSSTIHGYEGTGRSLSLKLL